jgi:hypothetical protein
MSFGGENMSLYAEGKQTKTEDTEVQCTYFKVTHSRHSYFCNSLIPLTKELKRVQFMNSM